MCESLKVNDKITSINFGSTELPQGSVDRILQLLENNLVINEITINELNNFSTEEIIKIKKKLTYNVRKIKSNFLL